jgi:hypothetical protein
MKDIEKKFLEIKQAYKEYYNSILGKGKLLVWDTDKGIWGFTNADDAFEFFKKIELQKYKNFLDLGSGDGIVVSIAGLFTNATGIEFDKQLHEKAAAMKDKLKINCNLICNDYMNYDFSKYDIIFINPDKGFHHGLEDKLLKELKGILFVHQQIFQPRFLKKGKTYWMGQTPIISYTKNQC